MTRKLPFLILMLCIIAVVQEFGLSRLMLLEVFPDALSVFLAFLAVTRGQKSSTSFGFAAGIIVGIISGNMGLNMLAKTVGGFFAGYFHSPDDSHATTKQKIRRFYGAVMIVGFSANAVIAVGDNPLGLPAAYRIVTLGLLESLLSLILAVIANWLFLRKSFAD
ncbi:MAG: rod shape-determining protein MreD [Chlorobium sp.]